MPTYLTSFRKRIKDAHPDSPTHCHWRNYDDLVDEGPLTGGSKEGLCNCPGTTPCAPHEQYHCASTADVLRVSVLTELVYQGALATLEGADGDLAPAVAKGLEAVNNLQRGGETLAEALNDSTLTAILHGYWGVNQPATEALRTIAGLKLPDGPSAGSGQMGCDCACWQAKKSNLAKEKTHLNNLIKASRKLSDNLNKVADDLTATFWNTAVPVLKGSYDVVKGFIDEDAQKAAEGLKRLYEYWDETSREGGRILTAFLTAQSLSRMKREAMLGVIYHDQQRAALTCQPTEKRSEPSTAPSHGSGGKPAN